MGDDSIIAIKIGAAQLHMMHLRLNIQLVKLASFGHTIRYFNKMLRIIGTYLWYIENHRDMVSLVLTYPNIS